MYCTQTLNVRHFRIKQAVFVAERAVTSGNCLKEKWLHIVNEALISVTIVATT